jgi:NitT/TauT family transport system substrate-binding protein
MSRRTAIGALSGAFGLTIAPLVPAGAQTSTVRASVLPIFDVAPLYAALQQGYFAQENITVTTQDTSGGAVGIPALIGGDFDVAYTNAPSAVLAMQRGIDLRIIIEGAGTQKNPPDNAALVGRKGEPFKTGKDVEGHILAVNQLNNVQWMIARSWVRATGGDPDKVTYLEIPIPAMLDALRTKRVDVAFLIDPFLTQGLEQTDTFQLVDWCFHRVYAGGPVAFWVITQKTVDTNAALIRAFVRGYRRGAEWVNENRGKPPLIALFASVTHVQPELIQKLSIPPAVTTVDTSHFSLLLNLLRDNGQLNNNNDLTSKVYKV